MGVTLGENKLPEQQRYSRRELANLTRVPHGTLAECIRAGGAGIPGFYTPAGWEHWLPKAKETHDFDGRTSLLERGLTADFALIKAWRGDTAGNLVYRRTARNFNPMMATAARVTIAEVEELSIAA